jgi:hypothetical protein
MAGKGISDATSGLFLAGPRRVGKSTFLLQDLLPVAQHRGWVTVYVDLWEDKLKDPALLITQAIKNSLEEQKGRFSKLAEQVKLQKLNILKAVELDFAKSDFTDGATLTEMLKHLIQLAESPVLLVVDEAQHALTSAAGLNAMFAIKSARDQINSISRAPELMLAFTGSNRDKLGQLVIKKDQPFFGSTVTSFPLLGRDFSDFFTLRINRALAAENQFSEESVWEAFCLTGHRPEILRQLVSQVAINNEASSFSVLLKQDASLWRNQVWEEFENDFNALPSLPRALLALLVKEGKAWSPFSDQSLQFYKKITGADVVTTSSAQSALLLLRERGIIWQSSRGSYALEDEEFAEWYKQKQLT